MPTRMDPAAGAEERGHRTAPGGGGPDASRRGPRAAHRRATAGRPDGRSWWRVLVAAAIVVVLVLVVVAVVVVRAVHTTSTGAVTSDPPPASNLSLGQVFTPPTNGLVSDPFVLPTPSVDYMYSSGEGGTGAPNLPLRTFRVMGRFLSLTDALPHPPTWVAPGSGLWAPDVRKVGNTYVMWYTGQYRYTTLATGAFPKCLGVATSSSPLGPFVPTSNVPSVCQTSLYGDIDPRTFVAPGGQEWLYWKNDGNAVTTALITTKIFAQRLAGNGQTLIGSPTVILTNNRPWEGWLVESPDMVRQGSRYYLFFSGNSSDVADNGVGLAACTGPAGPCTSPYNGPWFGSNLQGAGPGEETFYTQNGVTWMLYTPNAIYYPGALPGLAAARVAFSAQGMPYVANRQGMVPGTTAGAGEKVGNTT